MKTILTILSITCLGIAAQAQTAYQGGSGDGYAMDELVLSTIGVEEAASSFKVYPTLLSAGDQIRISTNNTEATLIEVTDLNGQLIIQQEVDGNSFISTDGLAAGMYLLYAEGNKAKAIRITLVK